MTLFIPWRVTSKPYPRSANLGWTIEANGCHIWRGGKGKDGYGLVLDNGKICRVHRLRYEREVGPIPDGLILDHYVCDTRACCNPHHVRPVTYRENNLRSDSIAARYASRTHCERGHLLGGDNAIPSRIAREGNRLCKTCYNAKRKIWRLIRLGRLNPELSNPVTLDSGGR